MSKKDCVAAKDKFDIYYKGIYGLRWPSLKDAMMKESSPVRLSMAIDETISKCLNEPYYMDRASILAASMLPVEKGHNVLDMCAAPGGKTLVLASKLEGTGALVSNDRSAQRRSRLAKVIQSCLVQNASTNIRITGHDSSKWSLHEKNVYDSILLDAPCSSERHVLNDESELAIWSETRPKRLAIQQFAMLAAALEAAVDGGFILYSTCSINPIENEMVIEKLHRKREGQFEEVCIDDAVEELKEGPLTNVFNSLQVEKLKHGQIVLPDASDFCGPLFFCLLRKTGSQTKGSIR